MQTTLNRVHGIKAAPNIGNIVKSRLLAFVFTLLIVTTVSPLFPANQAAGMKQAEDIQVPPPPFSEGIFPCSECHKEMETNPERRELEFHEDIVLKHDEKNRWCLDCHDARNRNMLHLASGKLVDFKESYKLCGQCHGPKLRDWRAGVHGRRTGYWNGQKKYLLCAHCHNPHSPRFKKLKPEPPPIRPGKIK
jgi:uncharacterized CHY-type Zn-finger protein